ncbi:hypothetical protein LJC49_05500 [Ruminococcaceae bacterium OttesenSCG-928-I18]|nr:hypothetical protein [Ruminococcaceae bacterium OttesenSCG-928-I18]
MRHPVIVFFTKCSLLVLLLMAFLLVSAHLDGQLSLVGALALSAPCLLMARHLFLRLFPKTAARRVRRRPVHRAPSPPPKPTLRYIGKSVEPARKPNQRAA